MTRKINYVFFGTPDLAVDVLDELAAAGYIPGLIVTAPDKPQGRGMVLTPPPVKVWAQKHNIEVLQPVNISPETISSLRPVRAREEIVSGEHVQGAAGNNLLASSYWDVFVVVAYGKILPQALLDIPKHGTLNVHPSLLPRWRGPSPVRAGILAGDTVYGVTVMLLDEKMDHGPILAQKEIGAPSDETSQRARTGHSREVSSLGALELEHMLMREGGALLADVLPSFLNGTITPQPQQHDIATYCKKITKEDGLLDLSADPHENLRKIRAYEGWPGTYMFFEHAQGAKKHIGARPPLRVKILDAHIQNNTLIIDRVIPEGKREMSYVAFTKLWKT